MMSRTFASVFPRQSPSCLIFWSMNAEAFEEGDVGAGQLSDFVNANTGHRPSFRKKALPPLQAADFAAYEVLKVYKAILVDTDKMFEKIRAPLRRLHEINNFWAQFRQEDLRVLCRTHDVERRTRH
ncbi:MAG: hypothetical protein LAN63_01485 [Acidobacteriia bacterium]|nr:hypothetical protein [Terriglobia bacterium]